MKKILSILPLLIFSLVSKSQYPVTQNLGSSSTLVQVPANGGFIANLINRTFVDTNAANSTNIKYYTGAQVYCSGDSSLYWRYNGAWIKMAGASGGATGSFWNLTGNYMNTIPSDRFGIGTNSADNLPLRTNATTRAYIPAAGFVRSNDTTSNKIFTLNPSTGEWGYANWNNGGGGSTPTWQQTLTAGSTLTTDNTIDGGGNDFTFANNSSLFLRSLNTQNFGSLYLTDGQAELVGQVTGARISRILALGDSLLFEPYQGDINIDTIRAASDQNKLIGWTSTTGATRGEVGAVTIGSGLSLSAGTLSASGSSGWSLSGNSISAGIGDFFGSTNNRTVIVKTNNTKIAAWDSTGSLEIGSYGHQSILGSNDAKLIVQGTFGQFESGVLKAYIGQVSANTKLVLRNSSASDAVTLNTSGDSWLNGGNVGIGTSSPISKLNVQTNSIGSTQKDSYGILLGTGTAATPGNQQKGAPLVFQGYAYKTGAGAGSKDVRWRQDLRPYGSISGAGADVEMSNSTDGGATYTTKFRLSSVGMLTMGVDVSNLYGQYGGINNMILYADGSSNYFFTSINNSTINNATDNIMIGSSAGAALARTSYNIGIGSQALYSDTSGSNNVAVGYTSLKNNLNGYSNTAIGTTSLRDLTTGFQNTAVGGGAGELTTAGQENSFFGYDAGLNNRTGIRNVYLGHNAKGGASSIQNVGIGYFAGASLTDSTANNVFIGESSCYNGLQKTDMIGSVVIGAHAYSTKDSVVVLGADFIKETYLRGNTGVSTTSPNSTLHINGSLTKSVTHVDADVTLNSTHYTIIIDAGSGGIIITLPAASSCTGREYVIVNLDIDATIDTYTDIKGSGSTIVKTNTALKIQSDGTGWYQTNN